MNETGPCIICRSDVPYRAKQGVGGINIVECPRCGHYEAGDLELSDLSTSRKAGFSLAAAAVRKHWDDTHKPLPYERREIRALPSTLAEVTITQRIERALVMLAHRTPAFGMEARIDLDIDWPVVAAVLPVELAAIVAHLQDAGLAVASPVRSDQADREWTVRLTAAGIARAEELERKRPRVDQVFVAMSFAPGMNEVFDRGLRPGIEGAGYKPLRVDLVDHEEKICDKILAEIRRSGLLVADFTNNSHGVYFEAGFAMGLGIPVIWCCREDQFGGLHFDTRQYYHIKWNEPEDLAVQIRDRILALYPRP